MNITFTKSIFGNSKIVILTMWREWISKPHLPDRLNASAMYHSQLSLALAVWEIEQIFRTEQTINIQPSFSSTNKFKSDNDTFEVKILFSLSNSAFFLSRSLIWDNNPCMSFCPQRKKKISNNFKFIELSLSPDLVVIYSSNFPQILLL